MYIYISITDLRHVIGMFLHVPSRTDNTITKSNVTLLSFDAHIKHSLYTCN